MTTDFDTTPECVMDVFLMIADELMQSGHENPLDAAARLTARVIERVEQDLTERPQLLLVPSVN